MTRRPPISTRTYTLFSYTTRSRSNGVTGLAAVEIGADSVAEGQSASALGSNARATAGGAVAIGENAVASRPGQVALGSVASTYTLAGIGPAESRAEQERQSVV